MFGAARAALATVRSSLALSKRHGTISDGSTSIWSKSAASILPSAGDFSASRDGLGSDADYEEGQVDETVARAVVGDMDRFLAAVEPLLKKVKQ